MRLWSRSSSPVLRSCLTAVALAQVVCSQTATQILCGDTQRWQSSTLPYSFCNNAWGDDGSGSSCLQVNNGGSSFQVSYRWTENYYNVHGYPYMKLEDSRIPINISEIASLNFSGQWTTFVNGTEDEPAAAQAQALSFARVRSNVAIDMFLDTTPELSQQFRPAYEFMIWFWSVAGIDPVGSPAKDSSGNQMQYVIEGVRFYLYYGTNDHGQHVYSWLSDSQVNSTSGDYYPLLHYLWQFNLISPDLYMGSVEFGTETFYAASPTVFSASQYNLSITTTSDSSDARPMTPLQTPSPVPQSRAPARWEISTRLLLVSCILSLSTLWELG